MVSHTATQSTTSKEPAAQIAFKMQSLAEAINVTILMTAAGKVVSDRIVKEARALAVTLVLAATAGAVTREMLREMLGRMADQTRKTDTEKWKKIIST